MRDLLRRALLLALPLVLAGTVYAEDPSDLFLRAYQNFQAGEKMERDGNPREAVARYKQAEELLQEIARTDATWQPAVVEYRLRKTRENLERLGPDVANLPVVEDSIEGPLPQSEPSLPPPAVNTSFPVTVTDAPRTPAAPVRRAPQDLPLPDATAAGSGSEAAALRRQLAEQRRENEALRERLDRQSAELKSALFAVDRTKVTVVELRSQLAQTQDALTDAQARAELARSPDARLKDMEDRLLALEVDNEVLSDENARLFAKLENAAKYIDASDAARKTLDEDRRKVAKQRDEAAARTKRIRDNQKEIERLTAESKDLKAQLAKAAPDLDKVKAENKELAEKLAEAEKKIAEAAERPAQDQAAVETLRSEINSLNDRLLEAQAQIAGRDEQIKKLAGQLDEASGDLARMRLNPEPSADDKKVIAENELLRGIILRQIREQSERDAARTELEKEVSTLQGRSENLQRQLDILAKPAFQLSDDEKALFREPTALLTEPTEEKLEVSMAVAKSDAEPPKPEGADALSETARTTIEEARKLFDAGRFGDAEKLYQQIAEESPENYFVLSNLGVTQIQSRKLSAAEVALKKAVEINPKDAFAATNLGIVYCKQGRFDDAIAALQDALADDENDHIAHNYLGVCLGEQGKKAEAEEHFKRSVAIREDYSDAHFNLAVLYATSQPPALDLARTHYDKAVASGAPPDISLERLINTPR